MVPIQVDYLPSSLGSLFACVVGRGRSGSCLMPARRPVYQFICYQSEGKGIRSSTRVSLWSTKGHCDDGLICIGGGGLDRIRSRRRPEQLTSTEQALECPDSGH